MAPQFHQDTQSSYYNAGLHLSPLKDGRSVLRAAIYGRHAYPAPP